MSQSGNDNGKGKGPLDNHYVEAASDEEILGYMHDLSREMENMCELRGYDDLKPVFQQARLFISSSIKRSGNLDPDKP
ncbi:hypothetical protein [Aquisalinus flavus]|uniref:Uncharacterized protein n=1 Tax=Aquisalinus flavus TaxID=1526572 RepID=A0A8J2V4A2_9PROT|nr:hypothetical protein [Aquisalinus flavus]MBD0427954.1 hypothetical protein [Aquisalinus flavus]UNE47709.1 hypothetical protein FF099_06415 [Aquisalinus flavus]GGD05252.1 hypothetical protein GCM10011342_12720 [Aquisalinus flavus]